jgi:hypothetical protein
VESRECWFVKVWLGELSKFIEKLTFMARATVQ